MKTVKFYTLFLGDTFYRVGDYGKIDQYEKTSDSYGIEILTNSSRWFDDEIDVYVE